MKQSEKSLSNQQIWAVALSFVVLAVCVTAVLLAQKPYTIRFEMDENARAAIESLNYSAIQQNEPSCNYGSIIERFNPQPNCSLVIIDENYKLQTCDGELLYQQIQEEKQQVDEEWALAEREGRLIKPKVIA